MAGANLSAEQTAKIQKIQSDRYAEMAKVRTEMFAKGSELQALFREPTLDQAKITTKQKEIAALQAQMQEKGLAARTAVAEVLTPEQRAQMPAFGPGMGSGFGPGFGFGRGFGPGMGMGPRMGFGPGMGFGPRW
jgi:Spy/CpxP family protein refolding chaperone